ncbi:AIPR family protein [Burkholderia ambifaria]|uniref:AIPR family protein n=1 Tax=Burkholderia ambifaria TaxID=152480 RepID=UPI00158C7E55|nr:AIPR family protein [Burkholderia ambifaria]
MDLDAFREELAQDVFVRADTSENFTDEAFAEVVAEYLAEAGSIEEFTPCKYIHRGVRVDGYSLNWEDGLLELYVVDCRPGNKVERMTKAEMTQGFKRAETFFEKACMASFVEQMEAAHPAYGLARTILEQGDQIQRVRFYLLTNAQLTGSVKELPSRQDSSREWSYRIWDLERLARTIGTGKPEEIVVDFEELFGQALVCLPADDGSGEVRSFVAVIPADWLARIYDHYGSRLLEQNVRTFLQARGKVNKGIRKTILDEPTRFFPYNNGISATAEEVSEERHGGVTYLQKVKNLQIVNGGQTTASIFNAFKKDKGAPIEQVSVQMKLSVVPPDIASELVPKISRFANSQNRISDSDFFSNHPFHVVIENLSRRLSAPAKDGSQILTHWFYERAKGQYVNAVSYLSEAKKREFLTRNPKSQVIDKTDLAKCVQTFRCLPHDVSLGGQKNFAKFAEYIGAAWEHSQHDFNELWFKRAVAEAIIFRRAESLVLRASWYAQGYRAQTVTYGIAMLVRKVQEMKLELDLQRIWREQGLSEAFEEQLLESCRLAQQEIIGGAARNNVINVTEWCKRKACWDAAQEVRFSLSSAFVQQLKERGGELADTKDARIEQKGLSEAEAYISVVNAGSGYWKNVRRWAGESVELRPSDLTILDIACAMPRKIPTEKQALRLVEIRGIFDGAN